MSDEKPSMEDVNRCVGLLIRGARFERDERGRLWYANDEDKYNKRVLWRLRSSDKCWPVGRKAIQISGGIIVQTLVQLSLWLKGMPRYPLRCIRHWFSYQGKVVEGYEDFLRALDLSSYNKNTNCVLCGGDYPTDWWSLDGIIGPCCGFGVCRNKDKKQE